MTKKDLPSSNSHSYSSFHMRVQHVDIGFPPINDFPLVTTLAGSGSFVAVAHPLVDDALHTYHRTSQ
jgi:hypothetical protein